MNIFQRIQGLFKGSPARATRATRDAPTALATERAGGICPEWGKDKVAHWSGRRLVPIDEQQATTAPWPPWSHSAAPATEPIPEPPAFLRKDYQAQQQEDTLPNFPHGMSTPPETGQSEQRHPSTKPDEGAVWIHATWRDKPQFKAMEADPEKSKKMLASALRWLRRRS